jgi:hypothetical protein
MDGDNFFFGTFNEESNEEKKKFAVDWVKYYVHTRAEAQLW